MVMLCLPSRAPFPLTEQLCHLLGTLRSAGDRTWPARDAHNAGLHVGSSCPMGQLMPNMLTFMWALPDGRGQLMLKMLVCM